MASARPSSSSVGALPRTLILDYYDSYTNNLLTLFTQLFSDTEVLRKVVVVKADRYSWDEFQRDVLPNIDCVILSPGPGSPEKPKDIGFALELIRSHAVPILGVCLGHQAIGVAFGAKIMNTPQITHGHVIPIAPVHPRLGLFASSRWGDALDARGRFDVVVYNSLTIDPQSIPEELEITAWSVPPEGGSKTVQGLRHKSYPIWGVQYHPESISSTLGSNLLLSFLDAVHSHYSYPQSYPPLSDALISSCAYRIAASRQSRSRPSSRPSSAWPTPPASPPKSLPSETAGPSHTIGMVEKSLEAEKTLRTSDVFEKVVRSRKGKEKAVGEIWLDGETPTRATTTSLTAPQFLFTYCLANRTITLHTASTTHDLELPEDESFWDWFSDCQLALRAKSGVPGKGWRGGWAGWFGYEMKEESLQGYQRSPAATSPPHDLDACWAWCPWTLERSSDDKWTLRGLVDDTLRQTHPSSDRPQSLTEWLGQLGIAPGLSSDEFANLADDVQRQLSDSSPFSACSPAAEFPTFTPLSDGETYKSKIDMSRESIRQGDSYELTLTTAFTSSLGTADPYALYLRLRTFNPAYYSNYMSFPTLKTTSGEGVHILSSSPERFLRIDKDATGRVVEMMPIKGTRARVKPGQCVCTTDTGCKGQDTGSEGCLAYAKEVDRRIGEALQADVKERAENLMIVDLIRSDLLSCCLPSTVTVPKLIALESYGVHNLVTTVRGVLADNVGSVEAVRRCFPPGSMTGAPKLRSVQLLEGYEDDRRRGIYSGALGYISADGQADLSVVIRTIVVEGDEATIGAGGAITWLSKRGDEWEEVKTKVKSVVGRVDG